MAAVDVVVEELEDAVRLLVVPAHDALRVGRVDEEGLLSGHGVHRHDRVDRLGDGAAQHGRVAVVADLAGDGVGRRVQCLEALEALAERGGEAVEGADGLSHVRSWKNSSEGTGESMGTYAGDDSVTAGTGGRLEHAEEGHAWRLRLGRLVDVELDRALAGPRLADAKIAGRMLARGEWEGRRCNKLLAVVDNDKLLRAVLGVRHPAVLVQGAKVRCNLLLLLKAQVGKVLVAEDEASALGAEEGHLVEAGAGELRLL